MRHRIADRSEFVRPPKPRAARIDEVGLPSVGRDWGDDPAGPPALTAADRQDFVAGRTESQFPDGSLIESRGPAQSAPCCRWTRETHFRRRYQSPGSCRRG